MLERTLAEAIPTVRRRERQWHLAGEVAAPVAAPGLTERVGEALCSNVTEAE